MPVNQDLQQIKTLSLFHFAVAGLAILCSSGSIFGPVTRVFELANRPIEQNQSEIIFTIVMTFFFIFLPGWIYAIGLIILGVLLTKAKYHTLCTIMAVVSCIFIPFGTVLGMFTLGILSRSTVKEIFKNKTSITHV